jgi:hypothetical protein
MNQVPSKFKSLTKGPFRILVVHECNTMDKICNGKHQNRPKAQWRKDNIQLHGEMGWPLRTKLYMLLAMAEGTKMASNRYWSRRSGYNIHFTTSARFQGGKHFTTSWELRNLLIKCPACWIDPNGRPTARDQVSARLISRPDRGRQPTDGCGPPSRCAYTKGGEGLGIEMTEFVVILLPLPHYSRTDHWGAAAAGILHTTSGIRFPPDPVLFVLPQPTPRGSTSTSPTRTSTPAPTMSSSSDKPSGEMR